MKFEQWQAPGCGCVCVLNMLDCIPHIDVLMILTSRDEEGNSLRLSDLTRHQVALYPSPQHYTENTPSMTQTNDYHNLIR